MIEKTMSVRDLAETAARSGSIDSRWAASVRAVEGTRSGGYAPAQAAAKKRRGRV